MSEVALLGLTFAAWCVILGAMNVGTGYGLLAIAVGVVGAIFLIQFSRYGAKEGGSE